MNEYRPEIDQEIRTVADNYRVKLQEFNSREVPAEYMEQLEALRSGEPVEHTYREADTISQQDDLLAYFTDEYSSTHHQTCQCAFLDAVRRQVWFPGESCFWCPEICRKCEYIRDLLTNDRIEKFTRRYLEVIENHGNNRTGPAGQNEASSCQEQGQD